MGEAKQRRTRTQKFIEQNPYCCYCGGTTPADTVDHIPSRQMFVGRHRPQGLEVPACRACNELTRQHEQVAAMLARFYPDPRTPEEAQELDKILKAVRRNHPLLFSELQPSWLQLYDYKANQDAPGSKLPRLGGPLNANGPHLNESMEVFSAKLCFGLYSNHGGHPVGVGGGVATRWYTNYDRLTGRMPTEVLDLFPNRDTLTQGKWSVSDQFEYLWALTEDSRAGGFVAMFRKAFAVIGFVHQDRQQLFHDTPVDRVIAPGFVVISADP